MTPEHVLVVAAAFCALWVLFRWGPPLLLLYAVARLWAGAWGEALLAFAFACLIENVNAYASWLEWNTHGRDAWLRKCRRSR
jgi:NhaP-type Na+/H+ and K+/H+ antiporter